MTTGNNKKSRATSSSSSSSSSSGRAHFFLPEEIMTDVFLRLPTKSILRFRAVCRSWNAELSSDEFCRRHMSAIAEAASPSSPSPSPPNLLFTSPTPNSDATAVHSTSPSSPSSGGGAAAADGLLFTLDDVRGGDFIQITPAPCRGLTLLHDPFAPAPYRVFNASTRSRTRLPPPPPCHDDAADQTAGLGFDAAANKYKVVRLSKIKGGYRHYPRRDNRKQQYIRCEIYTLGGDGDQDQWRPPAAGVPFRFCGAASAAISHARRQKLLPVFANGFLHWLLPPSFIAKRPRAAVLSFSVEDETFAWVRSPPFQTSSSGTHLVEIGGHLCMVRDLVHASSGLLEIWKLNDDDCWSMEHRIDLFRQGVVSRDVFVQPQIIRVLGSVGNCGSLKKRIVIATSKREVIVYDSMSQTLEEETVITIRETHSSHRAENLVLTSVSLFQESLVPVPKTDQERAMSAPLAQAAREILLRLPADCTVRCKLVCKLWQNLIESYSFERSYHSLHNNSSSMDKKRRPKIMLVGKGVTKGGSIFSFTSYSELLQRVRSSHDDIWLDDTKVICSKPCHGMNLISTEPNDYLYNPGTGFRRVYGTRGMASVNIRPWINNVRNRSYDCSIPEGHAFELGYKNVGLGFNLSTQDHVIVELFYHYKDFESRKYFLTCKVSEISRGSVLDCDPPPLPVSDMPPAYLAGMLYWMTDPSLGESDSRAVVSFDITRNEYTVFACPPCVAAWNSRSVSSAFVVELEGTLCAVLADPDAEELNIWKRENGQWRSAYTVYLEGLPGYSLGEGNVVVPWAVDPKDGNILLNTGRKLGFYDPATRSVENLYDLEEVLRVRRSTQQPPPAEVPEDPRIVKLKRVIDKLHSEEPRLVKHKFSDYYPSSSALSGNNSAYPGGEQCSERRDSLHTETMPLIPMLYEESLANYPRKRKSMVL